MNFWEKVKITEMRGALRVLYSLKIYPTNCFPVSRYVIIRGNYEERKKELFFGRKKYFRISQTIVLYIILYDGITVSLR